MKTFFAHIRRYNPDNTIAGNGGVTVAYTVEGNTVKYALAKCHEKDRYNKYTGRVKAAGRLNSTNYAAEFVGTKREFLDNMYSIFSDL